MIRLAIIGSNWITDQFIEAAIASGRYQLCGVYSRTLDKAQQFAQKYLVANPNVQCFTELEALGRSPDIDVVYIASPNALHAPQAMQMMRAGKHVICEKPLAANAELAQQMFEVAKQNNVILYEAFMSMHLPNFKRLQQELDTIGRITKAFISYCQYSSRYPKYLAGENPNTFNPAFANGSIMDIGYYCVASAVALFGKPESVQARAQLLESGVDGSGSVILGYPGFEVAIQHSKVSDSYLPCEIQGEAGVLQVQRISVAEKVYRQMRGSVVEDLSVEQHDNPMYYETLDFAEQFANNEMSAAAVTRSLAVAEVLTEIRRQTGVVFPQDMQ